jgi:hypothetical protein
MRAEANTVNESKMRNKASAVAGAYDPPFRTLATMTHLWTTMYGCRRIPAKAAIVPGRKLGGKIASP